MKNEILVSISCTTFNQEPFIRQCFDGFLNQICDFNFEVLVHDDASTDGTQEVIKYYQKKYPHVFKPFIQKKNQWSSGVRGMNAKYNFSRAKGKYIAMCEGDDYWTDPYKLQKQIDILEKDLSLSACFTNALKVNEDSPSKEFVRSTKRIYSSKEIVQLGGGFYPTPSLVFRNYKIEFPWFIYKTLSGDYALSLILACYGNFYYLNEVTCAYRIHAGGVFTAIMHNMDKRSEINLNSIELLTNFNTYSSYRFNKEVKKKISLISKKILLRQHRKAIPESRIKLMSNLSFRDKLALLYALGKRTINIF